MYRINSMKIIFCNFSSLPLRPSSLFGILEGNDGFVSPAQVLQCIRQLFEETQKREVDEDVSGICILLFEHVDTDKNGSIELNGIFLGSLILLSSNCNTACILNDQSCWSLSGRLHWHHLPILNPLLRSRGPSRMLPEQRAVRYWRS